MSANKDAFITKWSPRVGEDAARLYFLSKRLLAVGSLLVPVWIAILYLGHREFGIIGWSLMAIDWGFIISGCIVLRRMYQYMTERFGRRVEFLDSPTLLEPNFQKWCGRHGIDPETGRPVPPLELNERG